MAKFKSLTALLVMRKRKKTLRRFEVRTFYASVSVGLIIRPTLSSSEKGLIYVIELCHIKITSDEMLFINSLSTDKATAV